MRFFILYLLLVGCAPQTVSYYDVDESQSYDPIRITAIAAVNNARAICDGSLGCIKRNIGTIVYQRGNLCVLAHQKKHEKYGPKHSKKLITCPL